MKTYRVRNGRSFLHGGVSFPPGSVVTEKSCGLSEKALDLMAASPREILDVIDGGTPPEIAKPSGPATPPGAVVTSRPPESGDGADDVDFETLSKKDLSNEAKARGIEVPAKWSKAEIIAAIEQHDAAKAAPANPIGKFELDPETLKDQSLDNLNLMVLERAGAQFGRLATKEEAIAVLSRDYKKR